MSFRVSVSKNVRFRIKGVIPKENGVGEPFDFTLICQRMSSDELEELQREGSAQLKEVICDRAIGWEHVLDEQDQPIDFNVAALRSQILCHIGMPGLIFAKYVIACGAKGQEKN